MIHVKTSLLICAAVLLVFFTVFVSSSAIAQEKRQATVQMSATSATSSADALRKSIKQCGRACNMSKSKRYVSAGGGGTTRDYDCDDNGNCHCFGSQDCVAMAPICKDGTLGCNDQGCICEEG